MNKNDFYFITALITIFAPFVIWENVFNFYIEFNSSHGILTSFIKFAILATAGELIGLRIKEGIYFKKGFGILPKIIVWGVLGITIKFAFIVFASGVPNFLEYAGLNGIKESLGNPYSWKKLLVSFSISFFMNTIYAPMLMITHSITDNHIANNKGKLTSLIKPIDTLKIIQNIDWTVMWGFIIKKTIPFFWIPAHTITFLLPPDFQVLFAALLSIVLGVILAAATLKSQK